MTLALRLQHSEFSDTEVSDTVNGALRFEAEQARLRRDYYSTRCHVFETKYRLRSDKFMVRFESGALGDEADYFDWYAAKRGYDEWDRRYRILSGVSV